MISLKNEILTEILTKQLIEIQELILKSKGILLCGHTNPDGDCICSILALSEYLNQCGKKYISIGEDPYPETFHFMPNRNFYKQLNAVQYDPDDYDLVIVVDSGDLDRIGNVKELIKPFQKIVNIDHHKINSFFGTINLVLDKASSIGEILYYFFEVNNIKLNFNMALNIYISIVTDTGSFKYDSMHPAVHLIAAELLKIGVIPADYNTYLYQNRDISFFKLLVPSLSRIEFYAEGKIAVSILTLDDFKQAGKDDTDGIIENIGLLSGVLVYMLIKEKELDHFSASLRSKNKVDVAKVSLKFGGGGHTRAAGCRTNKLTLNDFKQGLIDSIIEQL